MNPGFAYLRDPLFVACVAIYLVNRLVLEPLLPHGFCHAHVNDLICVPFWVPVLLLGLRRLGLRASDATPNATEVLVPLLLWSLVFEVVLPQTDPFTGCATPDHRDVLCYATGALVAVLFWRAHYGPPIPGDTQRP